MSTLPPNFSPLPSGYPGPHAHLINSHFVRPDEDGDPNPFSAAFDFSFGTYSTPGLVRIVYGAFVVLMFLAYSFAVIGTFAMTLPTRDLGFGLKVEGSPGPGLLVLALGWMPPLLLILTARLGAEQVLATVRTAMDIRVLRNRWESQPGPGSRRV